jgi:hypothetical protein
MKLFLQKVLLTQNDYIMTPLTTACRIQRLRVEETVSRCIECIEKAFADSRQVVSSGMGVGRGHVRICCTRLGPGFCEHGNEHSGFIKGGEFLV